MTRTTIGSAVAAAMTAAVTAAAVLAPVHASAAPSTFPDRPINLVVPFTPGGSTDVLARILAGPLGEQLGQTVVIENKPGAGTVLGADYVSRAAPDGYTLLLSGASTYTVNPVVYKKLPYEWRTAFDPVGIVSAISFVLLANPDSIKAGTLGELKAEAAQGKKMNYASHGRGSASNFAGEMLNAATGIDALHVPYKGSGPAMNDLIGGQVELSVDTVVAAVPQVAAARVKAIAVTGAKRAPALPQVPTAVESGFPSVAFNSWFAVVAPRGTAPAALDKLVAALAKVAADPAVRERMVKAGFEPEYASPATFRTRVDTEYTLLKAVAEKSGISID